MNHFSRKLYPLASIAAGVCTLAVALPASAVDLKTADGSWTFSIDGNVNVDYVYTSCEKNPKPDVDVVGACQGTASGNSVSSVGNGLLPAAFTFGVATTQNGIDMSAHLGLYPGVNTVDGGSPNLKATTGPTNSALGTAGLDVRQVYLTFGNATMGTFTAGRNIGLFEQDAILNDMTLLGVGVAGNLATPNPSNTTLGSIGWGYIYTDWLTQMDYTTPTFSGASATFGIFNPINSLSAPGTPAGKSAPGFHAKIGWKGDFDGTKVTLSASGLEQQQKYDLSATTSGSFQGTGGDVFGKIDMGGFSFMASGYYAKGLGTTALFALDSDGLGHSRPSYGYLIQGTYKVGPTKFGINYGSSRLGYADDADRTANPLLVASNNKVTGGVYYDLTKNLMLLGELTWAQDTAHFDSSTNNNTSVGGNVGVFLAF
jgi:predicted porin